LVNIDKNADVSLAMQIKEGFGVKIADENMYKRVVTSVVSPSSAKRTQPMSEHQSSKLPEQDSTVIVADEQHSELHMAFNVKRQRVEVPESLFSFLSPFLSWDPILNVFDSLTSVSVSVLQELLERCLWLWAGRNNEFSEMLDFFTSAIQSLKVYEGKESAADPCWERFFEKYGCFETPRLWTLTERLMLMVACSWPFYLWDNIAQKKSKDSATLRIRGMALLHPRFTQFLRSRMLDLGFINDEDFPPQFSHFSAVNILKYCILLSPTETSLVSWILQMKNHIIIMEICSPDLRGQ
jgi:hypothetical protein